jgi:benzoyl-CoA reductase/2-hydroxyglutaryl-CoA dehydratase subunit BcrC/BadD/HgdB
MRSKVIKPIKVPDQNYVDFANSLDVDGAIYDQYINQYFVVINENNVEEYIKQVLRMIEEELKR